MDPEIYSLLTSYFEEEYVSKFFENAPTNDELPDGKELFISHIDKFLDYEYPLLWTAKDKFVPIRKDFGVIIMLIMFSHLSPVGNFDRKQIMHPCHLSYVETLMIVQKVLWWPGMDEDVLKVVMDCPLCETTVTPRLRASEKERTVYQQAFKKVVLDPHPFSSSMRRASDVFVKTGPVIGTPLPRYRVNKEATESKGASVTHNPVLKIVMEFVHPTTLPGLLMHEGAAEVMDQVEISEDVARQDFMNIFLAMLNSYSELDEMSTQSVSATSSSPSAATVPVDPSTANIAAAATHASADSSVITSAPDSAGNLAVNSGVTSDAASVTVSAGTTSVNSSSNSAAAATPTTVSGTSSAGHHFRNPKSNFEDWSRKMIAILRASQAALPSRIEAANGAPWKSGSPTRKDSKEAVAARKAVEKSKSGAVDAAEKDQENKPEDTENANAELGQARRMLDGAEAATAEENKGTSAQRTEQTRAQNMESSGEEREKVQKYREDVEYLVTGIASLLDKCKALNNPFQGIPQELQRILLSLSGETIASGQKTPATFVSTYSGSAQHGLDPAKMNDFEGFYIDSRELKEGKDYYIQHNGRCYVYSFLRLLLKSNQGTLSCINIPYTGIDTDIEFGLSLFDGIEKAGQATGISKPISRNRLTAKPLEILAIPDDDEHLFDASIPPQLHHVTPGPGCLDELVPKFENELNKQPTEDSKPLMYFDRLLLTFAGLIKDASTDEPSDSNAEAVAGRSSAQHVYREPTYEMRIGLFDPTRNPESWFEECIYAFSAIYGHAPLPDDMMAVRALAFLENINTFRHRHAMLMYITHFPLSSVAPTKQRPGYSCNLYRIAAPGPAGPIGVYVLYDEFSTFIMNVYTFEPQNQPSADQILVTLRRYNYDQSFRTRWRFMYVDDSIEEEVFARVRAERKTLHRKFKVERKPSIKFPFLERFINDYATLGYNWQDYIWQLVVTHNEAFLGKAYTPTLPPAAIFDYGVSCTNIPKTGSP